MIDYSTASGIETAVTSLSSTERSTAMHKKQLPVKVQEHQLQPGGERKCNQQEWTGHLKSSAASDTGPTIHAVIRLHSTPLL